MGHLSPTECTYLPTSLRGSKKNYLSLRVAILSVYSVCCVNVLRAVNRIACLLSPQL